MKNTQHSLLRGLCVLLLFLPAVSLAKPFNIATLSDGAGSLSQNIRALIKQETTALIAGEFDVQFPRSLQLSADHDPQRLKRHLSHLLQRTDVDMIIGIGPVSSHFLASQKRYNKPVIATMILYPTLQRLPMKNGTSGKHNLNYLTGFRAYVRDVKQFHRVVKFRHMTLLLDDTVLQIIPGIDSVNAKLEQALNVRITAVPVKDDPKAMVARLPSDTDAVMIAPLVRLDTAKIEAVIDGLNDRKLPTFSILGISEVELGAFMGVSPESEFQKLARRVAVNVQRVLFGEDPRNFKVSLDQLERLTINMATARKIGVYPTWEIMTEAFLLGAEKHEDAELLTLERSVQIALQNNLDLLAAESGVAAGKEQVKQARSLLLPQLGLNAQSSVIDEDRARAAMGQAPEYLSTVSLSGRQLIYSENVWANAGIEAYSQLARESAYRQTRLDLVRETVDAYLNLLKAKTLERIQQDNLNLTRSNLELARVRQREGMADYSEVYRWENEIANARIELLNAKNLRQQAETSLNQKLNRPQGMRFRTKEASLEDDAFVVSDPRLQRYVGNPYSYEIFSRFMVEEALKQSPEIEQLEASYAAQERALKAARRNIYLPDFSLQGEVTERLDASGAGADFPAGIAVDDHDWAVAVRLDFPLFESGAKASRVSQAREQVRQLNLQRGFLKQRVEQRMRNALHEAAASYPAIGLYRQAAEASEKNLELVRQAYMRGVKSVIDQLDAQNQSIVTRERAANSVYDFLIDFTEVERASGRFGLISDRSQRESWFSQLEDYFKDHQPRP